MCCLTTPSPRTDKRNHKHMWFACLLNVFLTFLVCMCRFLIVTYCCDYHHSGCQAFRQTACRSCLLLSTPMIICHAGCFSASPLCYLSSPHVLAFFFFTHDVENYKIRVCEHFNAQHPCQPVAAACHGTAISVKAEQHAQQMRKVHHF